MSMYRSSSCWHPSPEDAGVREASRSAGEGNSAEAAQAGFEGQAHIAVSSARAILQKGQWKAAKKYLQVSEW